MKHVYCLALTLLFLNVSSTAQAQITISQSAFESQIGNTYEFTFYSFSAESDVSAIVNASGANQTWDFSGFAVEDTASIKETYITLPADLAGSDRYPGATFAVEVVSDTFTVVAGDDAALIRYHSIDSGDYILHGIVLLGDADDDSETDTLAISYSPPSVQANFPLEYQKTWSDSSDLVITISGLNIIQSTEVTEAEVDGWGTLILPDRSVQALRLKSGVRNVSAFPLPTQTLSTDYEFLTLEGATASITLDENGSVTEMSYGIIEGESPTPIDDEEALPQSFQLSQNYPNPFNPSTSISYSLPATSDVTLKVFSITGQEISTLVQATQTAGTYEVSFDASELASGLYLYRLQTENFTQTRLMSLVK